MIFPVALPLRGMNDESYGGGGNTVDVFGPGGAAWAPVVAVPPPLACVPPGSALTAGGITLWDESEPELQPIAAIMNERSTTYGTMPYPFFKNDSWSPKWNRDVSYTEEGW